ncbi:MAG: PQQ-dependent sugar dehydrogenase [Hyphomonadaceae bacterium]|nr:PQQ-dependent sugar dehydrogenase [Hyphomonadaceae bacterium]
MRWVQAVATWARGAATWANLIVALALLAIGTGAGVVLQHQHVPRDVRDAVQAWREGAPPRRSAWTDVSSTRHQLQIASVRVWARSIQGGSIAQMGDFIVLASPQGALLSLDANDVIRTLGVRVRMNLEALRNDPLHDDPRFDPRSLRTHDLLAIETAPGAYDLYASFDRFSGSCLDFVVARHSFRVTADGVMPVGRWRDVWTAQPCLRWRDRGPLLAAPPVAGGRMEQLNAEEILIAVGDRHRDGYYDSAALANDASNDYGKIVALNIVTGAARHYAIGVRNPLGLAIDAQGRVWETEHGPQGGDELNLILEGRNYGWPIVTYGMNYGTPPRNWPANPMFGGHDGFERPRFVWVPSIGIANVLLPDANEFPHWSDSLLVTSLRENALFVVKLEGDEVAYAEPIRLGMRLRDAISLRDGRLAILADEHGLLLYLRNAEREHGHDPPAQLALANELPSLSADEAMTAVASPAVRGRAYYQAQCSTCHSVSGEIGIGPSLNGVVGRRIASVDGFGYSSALSQRDGVWTEARLHAFIDHPQEFAPGTAMPVTALPDVWTGAIVAYLKTTNATD